MYKFLITLTIVFSGAVHASETVDATVRAYFQDFNLREDAESLVKKYWHPFAIAVNSREVLTFESHKESAAWLGEIQSTIEKGGWVRSDITESATCQLSDSVALYSLHFVRVLRDGTETPGGATYTLFKSDRWRIVNLTFVNPATLVSCE